VTRWRAMLPKGLPRGARLADALREERDADR
jgi:hypothetical protein